MVEANICLDKRNILITGIAGFIGSNLAQRLFDEYDHICVIGIDNMNDYYDVSLKEMRLKNIKEASNSPGKNFVFIKGSIANKDLVKYIFSEYQPEIVVNLAAQAGVRYSIENPDAYIESNIMGFYNILESCRHSYDNKNGGVKHLVYASSSSIYGSNKKVPYSIEDKVDNPVSLYAATKKANELLAHSYSKLYNIPSTGLRFFTVYGPGGRPDMAYFKFTDKLVHKKKIQIFNYGNCKRDFTYIDDIITGLTKVMEHAPQPNIENVPYKIYNIGNSKPENLLHFVDILQDELKKTGILPFDYDFELYKELVGMQPGDVEETYADIIEFENDFGFKPTTQLREGLHNFAKWYKEFYMK